MDRKGQMVDGYAISSEAISVVKRMLAENPFSEGFGQGTYHVKDVMNVDLASRETFFYRKYLDSLSESHFQCLILRSSPTLHNPLCYLVNGRLSLIIRKGTKCRKVI